MSSIRAVFLQVFLVLLTALTGLGQQAHAQQGPVFSDPLFDRCSGYGGFYNSNSRRLFASFQLVDAGRGTDHATYLRIDWKASRSDEQVITTAIYRVVDAQRLRTRDGDTLLTAVLVDGSNPYGPREGYEDYIARVWIPHTTYYGMDLGSISFETGCTRSEDGWLYCKHKVAGHVAMTCELNPALR